MLDFKIKICGITNPHDAAMVVSSGADAIGLNFFKGSSRYVDIKTAKAIVDATQKRAKIVGLFVDSPWDEIHHINQLLRFDYIQLHGSEIPQRIAFELPPLIRAFRWPAASKHEADFIEAWTSFQDAEIGGYLVDANISGAFGGTGHTLDWQLLYPRPTQFKQCPLILAGGLKPENVGDAIVTSRADVVDTASGVEASPGKKDVNKLKLFVESAKAAFVKLNQSGESL